MSMIYFIAPVGGGNIKIGVTKNPQRRLRDLRNYSPLPLQTLACVPGNADDECKLHRMFFSAHSHGEWFRPSPEILNFIIHVNALGELPDSIKSIERHPSPLKIRGVGIKRSPEVRARVRAGIIAANARRNAVIDEAFRRAEQKRVQ